MNNPPTYSSWSYVPSQSADWTPTFNTQSWTDPNDTNWSYNANGLYFNDASVITLGNILVAGATFHTGLRQTKIISHSISGSQKHFWFNYAKLKREQNPTYGYWEWFNDVWGAYSDGNIPSTALRWMDNYEAQYDPDTNLPLPPPGNFPQSFYNQYNSKIVGAKYIQTKIQAPSVNFMRPLQRW